MSKAKQQALQQYIDLYLANRDSIEAHSAGILNQHRAEALAALGKDEARLEEKGDEGYEKTSIEDLFAPDLGVNIEDVALPVNSDEWLRCSVSRLSTLVASVNGDTFIAAKDVAERLPEGLTFMSLREAAKQQLPGVNEWYGRLANMDNAAVALNTLLTRDGVYIYVAKGVKIAKPLQIINMFAPGMPMAAFRRILIVAEEDAEVKLLVCDHTPPGQPVCLASEVVEVSLAPRANIEIYDIEESAPTTHRRYNLFARQGADSSLRVTGVSLLAGMTRNDLCVDLVDPGARTFMSGMAILTDKMHVDNDTNVRHLAPQCTSNQLYKYVVDDEAQGAFEGSILVDYGAKQTNAFQSNKNILAGPGARMHTKPSLEIYNDDVKCSHGASTGQLDEKALFYMESRGIPRTEARRMLMQAFMTDVIDTVDLPEVRARLYHLVERRFGNDKICESCKR